VFSFVVSFDQFSVSLFIVDSHTETVTVAIYNCLFQNNDPTVAAVSTVIIVLGFIAAAVTQRLVGLDRMIVGDGQGRVSA
jgi:putative spermidine/putrescine transport system permease protein